jgi:capsular exopolysaccharide synthesis family protein
LGLFVALIIGVIRLLFFERIENLRELRSIAKIPVIGSVPNHPGAESDPLVVDIAPKSNVAEAFRSLRTNIQYLLPGDNSKIILVTSLHPGEGKTFTSANLAAIFAKANKRVLLFDFDMHKPKVHKNFGVENISGVSTLLIGKAELADCIIPTQIENLDIVTAGPVPPNASELVLSEKVHLLLEEAKESYDFLFIDTPPLMLISDSLVLLKLADTGIFVLNTEKATKQGVRHLEEILGLNKLSHNSLLLNNVKNQRWRYYYGKYAYKYGYGYGYGYAYGSGYGYGYGYGYGEDPDNRGYGYSQNPEKKRRSRPKDSSSGEA